jgi:hypothetical protein
LATVAPPRTLAAVFAFSGRAFKFLAPFFFLLADALRFVAFVLALVLAFVFVAFFAFFFAIALPSS